MEIAAKTLTRWSEIQAYAKPGWLFRGQRSAEWTLKTSLELCYERQGVSGAHRSRVESELLREFKRTYHQYTNHVPQLDSVVEWLSVMRHHGAPTRLLDFTYSVYVAAYFALETADTVCAVWAVNGPWALRESVNALVREGKSDATKLQEPFQELHEKICSQVLFDPPIVKSAIPLNPFRLNERLRIQKGVFLVATDVATSFMDNLQALPGHDHADHIIKLILPSSVRQEALEQLFYMNISRTSLFPGLDGYAQSLGVYHPSFNPTPWI